ncbi:MAG: septation protein SepH [Schaalia turicensis]|nr:septation protein SepH [Schaalia turicensis]
MIELDLLGIGADGETLVFTDPNGERYQVSITDELRGSIRRHRMHLEPAPSPARQQISPREIQSLLRAGATPEEIATSHACDIEMVRSFESPIQAEKEYALQRAQNMRIGSVADGPKMGELVIDRLAARGVDPSTLEWNASRESAGPWQICLTFIQSASEHAANWLLPKTGPLEAIDQEAQWLTETQSSTPAASIFTPLQPNAPDALDPADLEEVRAREAIIDQLNASRGKPQDIEYDLDDEDFDPEEFEQPTVTDSSISAHIYSLAHARTKEEEEVPSQNSEFPVLDALSASTPIPSAPTSSPKDKEAPNSKTPDTKVPSAKKTAPAKKASTDSDADYDDQSLPGLENLVEEPHSSAPASAKKSKSRRRSVPSWDEIVFGSKSK